MTLEEAKNELEKFVKLKTTMRPAFLDVILKAEPVVHCKDCKHYTLHCTWNGEKRYWCELDILHDGENGFCSQGTKMHEVEE